VPLWQKHSQNAKHFSGLLGKGDLENSISGPGPSRHMSLKSDTAEVPLESQQIRNISKICLILANYVDYIPRTFVLYASYIIPGAYP
jgi:hypothetical protein